MDQWQEDELERQKIKLNLYQDSLLVIFSHALERNKITLGEIKDSLDGDYGKLIPNVEIFKEILIELLKNIEINLEELKKEDSEGIVDNSPLDFQVKKSILNLMDKESELENISKIRCLKLLIRTWLYLKMFLVALENLKKFLVIILISSYIKGGNYALRSG